jgi:hypothetical protein
MKLYLLSVVTIVACLFVVACYICMCTCVAGRMQLERVNEGLRIQLSAAGEHVLQLQRGLPHKARGGGDGGDDGSDGSDDDGGDGGDEDSDGLCDGGGSDGGNRGRGNEQEQDQDQEHSEGQSGRAEDSNCSPPSSPPPAANNNKPLSSKLSLSQLQRELERSIASERDNEKIIQNLNNYIDTTNLASSDKINDLMKQNVQMKGKLIQMNAHLDNARIHGEESEKKVLSLVAERHNMQGDMECQVAQIMYMKSRQLTASALEACSPSRLAATTTAATGDSATTVEMVNTLLLQNENLLASNRDWEQRYESMDLQSKAAVKSRKQLTEEAIELKSALERLSEDRKRLEETNETVSKEAKHAKHQAKLIQKDAMLWRKKYEEVVGAGDRSLLEDGGDDFSVSSAAMQRGVVYGASDVTATHPTSPDSEKDYLIHVSTYTHTHIHHVYMNVVIV